MNYCSRYFLIAFSLTMISYECMADPIPMSKDEQIHSSPQAVFDTYRAAYTKRDWRTFFSCLSPELENTITFEAFFAASMHSDKPEVRDVLSKYVDKEAAGAEYKKQYKELHGVDIEKLLNERAERQDKLLAEYYKKHPETPKGGVSPITDAELGPPVPMDDNALVKAVNSSVIDKAGFVGRIYDILSLKHSEFSSLKHLEIQGATATGRYTDVSYQNSIQSAQSLKIRFCKLEGKWIIDWIGVSETTPHKDDKTH